MNKIDAKTAKEFPEMEQTEYAQGDKNKTTAELIDD